MAELRCSMCGGDLDVNLNTSIGICKYCNSKITIPRELGKKGRLYNRATYLRQNCEFDKAVSVYEDILKENNEDAEAHWGLLLSKYGIEYVVDPLTGNRVPTCHRAQVESILADNDYKAAITFADPEAKKIYMGEANRIYEIQKKILNISKAEKPYDIFICYKESDERGDRTLDSVLAQDLFVKLTEKGYRTFFARKTLETRLGSEYEPIIFSAIHSAKIMIVIGTKPEHYQAVWVRNEWSRYLELVKIENKTIIPAFQGMSPYELPEELSLYQALDMSKIGFMQDLLDGIEKIMKSAPKRKEEKDLSAIERMIKNGETLLKLQNYNAAEELYVKMTKEYPERYNGWWGLILCKTNNLQKSSNNMNEIVLWMSYIKQLASVDEYNIINEKYKEFLKIPAKESARNNAKSRIGQVKKIEEELMENIFKYTNKKQEILAKRNEIKKTIYGYTLEIEKYKNSLRTLYNKETHKKDIKYIVSLLILLEVVLLLFLKQMQPITYGYIAISIAFVLVGFLFVKDLYYYEAKEKTKKIMRECEKLEMKINMLEEQLGKDENTELEELTYKMDMLYKKIDEINAYVDQGIEKISELEFYKICKNLDIDVNVDSSIIDYSFD